MIFVHNIGWVGSSGVGGGGARRFLEGCFVCVWPLPNHRFFKEISKNSFKNTKKGKRKFG